MSFYLIDFEKFPPDQSPHINTFVIPTQPWRQWIRCKFCNKFPTTPTFVPMCLVFAPRGVHSLKWWRNQRAHHEQCRACHHSLEILRPTLQLICFTDSHNMPLQATFRSTLSAVHINLEATTNGQHKVVACLNCHEPQHVRKKVKKGSKRGDIAKHDIQTRIWHLDWSIEVGVDPKIIWPLITCRLPLTTRMCFYLSFSMSGLFALNSQTSICLSSRRFFATPASSPESSGTRNQPGVWSEIVRVKFESILGSAALYLIRLYIIYARNNLYVCMNLHIYIIYTRMTHMTS